MQLVVSIIIPFYKGERFIGETLDSIFAQDCVPIEVIVVNDGSPIESLTSLESYQDRIRVITQENKGQAAARNAGLKESKGSIIAFIDQDDIWPAGRLSRTLQVLEEGYDFVRGKTIAFEILPQERRSSDPMLLPVLLGAGLYRRSVFDRVGVFNESMHEGEDFDWNVRLDEANLRGKNIDEVTLLYRKHGDNYSIVSANFVRKGIFATLKNKLDRKKGQGMN